MAEDHWLRRRWKLVLNLVTLGAFVLLIVLLRHQIAEALRNVERIHAWVLLLMIPIEFLNYHAQARLYQRMFGVVGNDLPYWHLFKVSLELNFVNHVFPSGGVTGLSFFSLRLREGEKLTGTKATMVHFMKLMLMFLSFELMILFGVLALASMGRANNLVILVSGSLSTLLIVGTAAYFYIIGSHARINSFFTGLTRALNRVVKVVRPKHPETIKIEQARRIVDDFHENYMILSRDKKALRAPFWYAFLANITEVAVVYVVFVAFGHWVNIGSVILAYAIANFAGLISVLPGGVGIYEALMVTVLASTGVPAAISLPVIVTYRVINTLIQIPPGYYLYHQSLRRNEVHIGE